MSPCTQVNHKIALTSLPTNNSGEDRYKVDTFSNISKKNNTPCEGNCIDFCMFKVSPVFVVIKTVMQQSSNECTFYCFIILFIWKWKKKKKNQLVESSPNLIFVVVSLDRTVLEERWNDGESWPNDFNVKGNRSEDLGRIGYQDANWCLH